MKRVIAFYLPQFHPIPENDLWWGKGFTEWTNTAKAVPLFPGHYQPHIPADLGFYDLRVPETRELQAQLAARYGVDGFCYYHYWFAGRRLLERPFDEVLATGKPEFPFCLCWANQTWSGVWHGAPDRILMEQTYPGFDDHARHFEWLQQAFADRRYMTVDGKPLFLIFRPMEIPDIAEVLAFWRDRAKAAGFPGLYLVGVSGETYLPAPGQTTPVWNPHELGFDASVRVRIPVVPPGYLRGLTAMPVLDHDKLVDYLVAPRHPGIKSFPCVGPNWDSTPRSGHGGIVFRNSHPDLFRRNLRQAFDQIAGNAPDEQLVFVKAWNEWAEGNHLEPDLKFGHGWLEAIRDEKAIS